MPADFNSRQRDHLQEEASYASSSDPLPCEPDSYLRGFPINPFEGFLQLGLASSPPEIQVVNNRAPFDSEALALNSGNKTLHRVL